METHHLYHQLSDDELSAAVTTLARSERSATIELVRSLMEFDDRRLYLREGCASLFAYCTQVLGLEEGAAYNRIEVARVARRHPAVLDALEAGEVTLTSVRLLAPHVTPDNVDALLDVARGRTRREVEAQIALLRCRPAPPAPSRVVAVPAAPRTLPVVSGPSPGLDVQTGGAGSMRVGPAVPASSPAPASSAPSAPSAAAEGAQPRADYRLHVTISADTYETLQRAQRLLRHAVPSGDPAVVIDRALSLLVAQLERRRSAATDRPRCSTPHASAARSSRHLPAAVRREVWRRDEGRCAFVGRQGRCRERAWLEFHHVTPYARGGPATVDNIELRCRAHNAHEAVLAFGPGHGRGGGHGPSP